MVNNEEPGLFYLSAFLTHTGMVRRNNEDSVFVTDVEESGEFPRRSFGMYIIADGMGGHQAGEIASDIATRVISETLLKNLNNRSDDPAILVKQAIEKANKEIFRVARTKPELYSMGTTVTLGLRIGDALFIGHVGDSRAYLVRAQGIRQLTEDHSVIAYLLKEGAITPQEAKIHPDRGVILRCLGLSSKINIDTSIRREKQDRLILNNDDYLVFCSDGLTGQVLDDEILTIVMKDRSPDEICKKLIGLANGRGGDDNISVIVVQARTRLRNNV